MRTWKIGVYGSAEGDFSKIQEIAEGLGKALGEAKVTVITGASSGIPFEVAKSAKKHGAKIHGYAPAKSYELFKEEYGDAPCADKDFYDELTYVPETFDSPHRSVLKKYRNVTSTAETDAGIVISGRIGTLNEFTNLSDFGKVIGVLKGTGGTADMIEQISGTLKKKNNARLVYSSDPHELVRLVVAELEKVTLAMPTYN